ncbi:response regulator receiver protein [Rubidibacter lacunae KORDI 51-2]|uniref:Response regulator receiver protein n=2 Tax=Rubidibacter TaxID=582491 RepID=U5DQP8_9CHRO|nr:response regulator receiver protein [Rubidibacter lacunae KORDI 51-2]
MPWSDRIVLTLSQTRMKDTATKDKKQLLLIDDDPNLILLVKDYLEFRGYDVLTAKNGRNALEVLKDSNPDMIICDVMMPEMDGYELVEKVRRESRSSWIPILFLSAKGQTQDRIKGLSQGADIYMVKPFEPEELVAQVESSLKQASRLMRQPSSGLGELSDRKQVPPNVGLTRTETKVVQLVAQGLANREIAEQLNVSQRTIESHVSNMLNKTRLHNRTELARWVIESNLAQ